MTSDTQAQPTGPRVWLGIVLVSAICLGLGYATGGPDPVLAIFAYSWGGLGLFILLGEVFALLTRAYRERKMP